MIRLLTGDARELLKTLPDESVHCCVTSPPYFGLRDYGMAGQIGMEKSPAEFVETLVDVFAEVRRILRDDGTLWLNLGDSYNGSGKGGVFTEASAKQATNHGANISKPMRIDGLKPKDLCGIPWRVAFALQADGWYLRQDIIWSKPNPMPESVRDRCTKAHEYIFLLSKSARYYYDADAIAELCLDPEDDQRRISQAPLDGKSTPSAERNGIRKSWNGSTFDGERDLIVRPNTGRKRDGINRGDDERGRKVKCAESRETRNKRSVWEVTTKPYSEAHFATFPPDLIEPCIKAGCPVGGTVLDPFSGAGTTGLVSARFQRNYIGIELNKDYVEMSKNRIEQDAPMFNEVKL